MPSLAKILEIQQSDKFIIISILLDIQKTTLHKVNIINFLNKSIIIHVNK